MSDKTEVKRIKILKNGPYFVTGKVKLTEKIITPDGRGYKYVQGKEYPLKEEYSLCRCGKSKNHPFCDGSHIKEKFKGKERAKRSTYMERAVVFIGEDLDLIDDKRCGFARFCHTKKGIVWDLIKESGDNEKRDLAIKGAKECPTGRLLAVSKEGEFYEDEYEPVIEILQDPEKGVSGGLFVKGGIDLIGEDGYEYEKRNRYLLCRCGRSRNKPFCDAMHVVKGFYDEE